MTPQQLHDALRPLQEKKGYFFNQDMEMTMALLEQLLVTKERFGYMTCPCRLACGERDKDRDIVCPCDYREADVAEYGSCYCGLYVSQAWREGRLPLDVIIPERRPVEKMF